MVDTNLLLRSIQPESAHYAEARAAISSLAVAGHAMCVAPQVVAEFWSVATRPSDVNGLGWNTNETALEIDAVLRRFMLLPDTPSAFPIWLNIVRQHNIKGKKVHDARLAAVMQAHGVVNILTFNVDDFSAFSEIRAVHPAKICPGE